MANLEEYVDLDQLAIWKTTLEQYNVECLDYITEFIELSLQLKAVWSGVAASGFDENFQKQIDTAKDHHSELKDVTQFLSTFAETVKNE